MYTTWPTCSPLENKFRDFLRTIQKTWIPKSIQKSKPPSQDVINDDPPGDPRAQPSNFLFIKPARPLQVASVASKLHEYHVAETHPNNRGRDKSVHSPTGIIIAPFNPRQFVSRPFNSHALSKKSINSLSTN